MIEKINPTIPIPITSSPIPDEQREIIMAKSSIAIPNPIFFIVNPPLQMSIFSILQTGIEISCIPRDLIIVIFYYQISLKPLKTLSLAQVSFPLLFPLCYIVPPVFTNSDKGKYKGKKTDNTL